jgi:hypothetical protein
MRGSDVFPGKYLKSDGVSEDLHVTIVNVAMEQVGDKNKPVAYFEEIEAGLALNKTNWGAIKEIAESDDSDDWKGTKIVIYVKPDVEYQGKIGPALRVKTKAMMKLAAKPAAAQAAEAKKIMWPAEVVKAMIDAGVAKNEFGATAILNNSGFGPQVATSDAVAFGKLYRAQREKGLEPGPAFAAAKAEYFEI